MQRTTRKLQCIKNNSLLAIALHIILLSTTTTSITSSPSSSLPLQKSIKLLRSFEEEIVKKVEETQHYQKKQKSFQARLFSKLKPLRRKLDYYDYDDEYNKDDDAQDNDDYVDDGQLYNGEFAFDMAKYSVKYARCQTIKTFSDEMAQNNADEYNGVLTKKRFIVFRLCPYNYCSSDVSYGCSSNYGEYIIELDDYMQIMKEQWEDKIDNFCEYCEGCYRRRERRRMRNLEGDDAYAADDAYADDYNAADDAGDDAVAADDYNADAGDDAAAADDNEEEDEVECDDICTTYSSNVCSNRNSNDDDNANDNQIFECTEFESDDGVMRYIGPHCASDGRSIVLGLFSDQYCTQVVGDTYDAASFSGLDLAYDGLAGYYPQQCIPCNAESVPYLENENGDDDENNEQIANICKELYYGSAQCDHSFKNKLNIKVTSNEAFNDQLVCNFITNVVTSQYDEYGDIYVSNRDYRGQDTYFKSEVVKNVTPIQIIWLGTSIFLTVFLLMYACYLHRAIMRKAPWRPRRGGTEALAGQISRQNSGIVMGRSQSGSSSYRGHTGGTLL